MIRAFGEELLLFLVPFFLFALVLVLRRRDVLHIDSWSPARIWLVTSGLLLVLASLVYTGLFSERHRGAFVPTHLEDGQVVPGHFR